MAFELEIAPIPTPALCCRSSTWADETWKEEEAAAPFTCPVAAHKRGKPRRPGPTTMPQPLLVEGTRGKQAPTSPTPAQGSTTEAVHRREARQEKQQLQGTAGGFT